MTSNIMNNVFIKKDPEDWKTFLTEFDYPKNNQETFLCLMITYFMMMFPGWLG